MTGTFAYVGNWTVKEGKVEEVRKYLAEHAEVVETNEKSPQLTELLEPWSGRHVPERYLPEHVAGFTRSTIR